MTADLAAEDLALAAQLADRTPVAPEQWADVIAASRRGAEPVALTLRARSLLATAADALARKLALLEGRDPAALRDVNDLLMLAAALEEPR